MSEEQKQQPFKNLGDRLKTIRQKLHESVAEVSGAVEIEEKALQRIERGDERPSEDILMLLISHFGMRDEEAAGLWQLAGYDQPKNGESSTSSDESNSSRTMVMIMAVDPRIIFSDGVQITANKNGVVMNFLQGTGSSQMTTSRIGMSREQALDVLQVLGKALSGSEPKQLSSGMANKDNETENKK